MASDSSLDGAATPLAPGQPSAVLSVASSPSPPRGLGAGQPAPVTPEWMLRAGSQPCPSNPDVEDCPICMCAVPSAAAGPEVPFVWPSCGHRVHLGCVAHLRVNSRHMSCPFCCTGWTSVAEERFAFQCPRTRSPCLRRPRHTTLVPSLSLPSLLPPLRHRLSRLFAASM